MKVVPKSLNTFLKAPITFWKPEEEQEILTTGQSHADATIHEVKYNPSEKKSGTYKVYIAPFAFGDAEQWLQFKSKLDLVINGQGLLEDGPARFNLTRSLLKGEALRVFNDKALELKSETKNVHIKCLQAVTEHVFPEQALHTQKRYMRRSVFNTSHGRCGHSALAINDFSVITAPIIKKINPALWTKQLLIRLMSRREKIACQMRILLCSNTASCNFATMTMGGTGFDKQLFRQLL